MNNFDFFKASASMQLAGALVMIAFFLMIIAIKKTSH